MPQAIDVDDASSFVRDIYRLDSDRIAENGDLAASDVDIVARGITLLLPAGMVTLPSPRRLDPAATGCTCTSAGCTFPHCGDGTWTLDGNITVAESDYVFDVRYTDTYPDNIETWHFSGHLTIAPTQLDGSITQHDAWTDGTTADSSAELRAVVVDATHCPIGGVVHGDNAEGVPGDPQQTFHVAGDATFATKCALAQ